MPKTFAASRGASSFCTVRLLRIRRIPHSEPYYQYVSIRMRRRSVIPENGTLISQRFAGLQRMRDALLCFLFAAEGDEGLALEIENILFADQLRRSERAAGENVRELAADMGVVLRGISAAHHHVDGEFRTGKELFAEHFDLGRLRAFLPACREGLVSAADQGERYFLGIGD